jgi:hypothetical protein
MPDPLDDLREPVVPLDPDPEFAAYLRSHVEQRLRSQMGGGGAAEAARNQLHRTATEAGGDGHVALPPAISVKDLAECLRIRPVDVIKKLMVRGVMATVNGVIDYGTAETVAEDFGYTVEPIAADYGRSVTY